MDSVFIGDKAVFAVEYKVSDIKPYLMGYFRLWVSNCYIGDFEEEVMLGTSACCLTSLLDESRVTNSYPELNADNMPASRVMTPEEKFSFLSDDDDAHDNYMFNVAEATDDFAVFAYRTGEDMDFLWKIHYPRRLPKNLKKYPREMILKKVPFDIVKQVVEEFDNTIKLIRQPPP